MPKVRDIICRVSVEIAERKRICHRHRNGYSIFGGEACLVVRDDSGGKKNYCKVCAAEILISAKRRLAKFEQDLGVAN
jgi:hypothetical protein